MGSWLVVANATMGCLSPGCQRDLGLTALLEGWESPGHGLPMVIKGGSSLSFLITILLFAAAAPHSDWSGPWHTPVLILTARQIFGTFYQDPDTK